MLAICIVLTLSNIGWAAEQEDISTESLFPEVENVALGFLDNYLRAFYLYEETDYESYTVASLPNMILASEISYDNATVSIESFLENTDYLNDKVRYWQYVRQDQEIYRTDYNVNYTITDCEVTELSLPYLYARRNTHQNDQIPLHPSQ